MLGRSSNGGVSPGAGLDASGRLSASASPEDGRMDRSIICSDSRTLPGPSWPFHKVSVLCFHRAFLLSVEFADRVTRSANLRTDNEHVPIAQWIFSKPLLLLPIWGQEKVWSFSCRSLSSILSIAAFYNAAWQDIHALRLDIPAGAVPPDRPFRRVIAPLLVGCCGKT